MRRVLSAYPNDGEIEVSKRRRSRHLGGVVESRVSSPRVGGDVEKIRPVAAEERAREAMRTVTSLLRRRSRREGKKAQCWLVCASSGRKPQGRNGGVEELVCADDVGGKKEE